MIVWLLILTMFGLVAIEQQSVWPFAFAVATWLLVSPSTNRMERTATSDGRSLWWLWLLGVVLFGPFILAILTNWRGTP
jgi:dolichol kinase